MKTMLIPYCNRKAVQAAAKAGVDPFYIGEMTHQMAVEAESYDEAVAATLANLSNSYVVCNPAQNAQRAGDQYPLAGAVHQDDVREAIDAYMAKRNPTGRGPWTYIPKIEDLA